MLSSLFLRVISRDYHALVKFLADLDTRLESFLVKHDGEVAKVEAKIAGINDTAKADIEKIQKDAAVAVSAAEEVLAAKAKAAAIIASLKSALPNSKLVAEITDAANTVGGATGAVADAAEVVKIVGTAIGA